MPFGFTNSWSNANPLGSDNANKADDDIRETRLNVQERMDVEHHWPATDDADTGRHVHDTAEPVPSGSNLAGALYWEDDAGDRDCIWMNDGSAWVRVGCRDVRDLDGLTADFAPIYLLKAGGEMSGNITMAGTELVDTLDLDLHNHDGTAAAGVLISGLISSDYQTVASFVSGTGSAWADVGAQVTFTPEGSGSDIFVLVSLDGSGASGNQLFSFGLQFNAAAEVAVRGIYKTIGGTDKPKDVVIIYHVTGLTGAQEIDVRVLDAGNAITVTDVQMLVLEIRG